MKIVASDSIEVMPPIKFLAYMIVPSVISEYITLKYIEYCWLDNRKRMALAESQPNVGICECCPGVAVKATYPIEGAHSHKREPLADKEATVPTKISRRGRNGRRSRSNSNASDTSHAASEASAATAASAVTNPNPNPNPVLVGAAGADNKPSSNSAVLSPTMSLIVCSTEANIPVNSMGPLSPRPLTLVKPELLERKKGSESVGSTVARIIVSPLPYIMLILLGVMIVMIFVDVMAISGLICVSAIIMVLTLTYGNHWKGAPMCSNEELGIKHTSTTDDEIDVAKGSYAPVGDKVALSTAPIDAVPTMTTHEQRVKIREEFYEEMFDSIDYNLLFIFLGLFVVIANLQATGIPKLLWEAIVGPQPFSSAGSVIGISAFVLLASQTLGNVAVCQLAVPNIEPLDDDSKRYAWAIVSFVSTIGGNLLLTGSAANLIVAEKAMRVDPTAVMNFSNHARVCFMTCVISCAVGMGTITLCNMIELSLK